MPELIALRAAFGQDEANHGIRRYRVGGDGLVHVPAEAALFLVDKGGFAVAKMTVVPVPGSSLSGPLSEGARSGTDPSSVVRLHHDEAGGCSDSGCEHQSDDNGDVLVPAEAVVDMMAHGFVLVAQNPLPGELGLGPKPIGPERPPVGDATSTASPAARG
jgi:hypothetical protein